MYLMHTDAKARCLSWLFRLLTVRGVQLRITPEYNLIKSFCWIVLLKDITMTCWLL